MSEFNETLGSKNKALSYACEMALRQASFGKHLVSMTNASFRSASYALMIENDLDQKI